MAECKVGVTFDPDPRCQALFSGEAPVAAADDEACQVPMDWHTIPHITRPNRAPGTAYGVDGCKKGWFAFGLTSSGERRYGIATTFDQLVSTAKDAGRIFVDIPIGLPRGESCDKKDCDAHHRNKAGSAVRRCDVKAREKLRPHLTSTVFPVLLREVLCAGKYGEANDITKKKTGGKGLTRQSYALRKKIKEVDDLLQRDDAACQIREVHPEICFWALAGREAMRHSKQTSAGFRERLQLLQSFLPSACSDFAEIRARFRCWDLADDDIVDAMAAAVTASASEKMLGWLPDRSAEDDPPRDCCGRRMEMVYTKEAYDPDWPDRAGAPDPSSRTA